MRGNRLAAVLGMVVLTSAASVQAQTAAPKAAAAAASVSDKLMANEKALLDAVVKHDLKTFNSFLAPDAWSVDEGGLMAVSEFTKLWDQVKAESQMAGEMKVVTLDPASALVTYKLAQKGTFQGMALPPIVYATTTWVNRGGKWVAVFHQESTAAPAQK